MNTIISCPCGNKVEVKQWLIKRKKYCSRRCLHKYHPRPSGLVYVLHKVNPTSFKKGHKTWNIGRQMTDKEKNNLSEKNTGKHFSIDTEFKHGENSGAKNTKWKGDGVGYFALHTWVYRKLGRPKECVKCSKKSSIVWSNISGEYQRNISDWQSLCRSCHTKYDLNNIWGKATMKYPEIRKEKRQ